MQRITLRKTNKAFLGWDGWYSDFSAQSILDYLTTFEFVGVVEELQSSLIQLEKVLGMSSNETSLLGRQLKHSFLSQLDQFNEMKARFQGKLCDILSVDLQLYNYALARARR